MVKNVTLYQNNVAVRSFTTLAGLYRSKTFASHKLNSGTRIVDKATRRLYWYNDNGLCIRAAAAHCALSNVR